ncbi:MAG TPA: hypothetical protein VHQ87_15115 [Rhizobacter sp.]|jgi:hypothetical protein|nr:hypothetical protein [Rhizobacter sp.]
MLIALLLGLAVGLIAPALWYAGSLWSAIPRSNADFAWLDL